MYEELLNNKRLNTMAGMFMSLPARSYSIQEIASVFKVSSPVASHSLNKLSYFGVLSSFMRQGKKFFFYKPSVSFPAWVKSKILKNKKKQEDRLFNEIKSLGFKAVFLSGIFLGYSNLPVDLLLIGKADLKKFGKFLEKWQKIFSIELNYSLMAENEYLERRNTFDKFIKDIFDHRHLIVVDKLKKV